MPCYHAIMDSLANYGSDGDNSNNSEDQKVSILRVAKHPSIHDYFDDGASSPLQP